MFYQSVGDKLNLSGSLEVPDDKNMLVLTKHKKRRNVSEYWRAVYEYEWTTYKE